jgi:hypothetical protein
MRTNPEQQAGNFNTGGGGNPNSGQYPGVGPNGGNGGVNGGPNGPNGGQQRLVSLPPSSTSRLLLGPRQGQWTPYDSKSDRPLLQLTLRSVLWGALVVGCVGGVVAIARPAGETAAPPEDITVHDWLVPGPVSAVAEDTVQRWFTATGEQREGLAGLFVQPLPDKSATPSQDGGTLQVNKVRAVAGQLLQEGYWSVTVSVEVVVPPRQDPTSTTDPNAAPPQPTTSTWFAEIGIVSDGHGGFIALATPAVVPAPAAADPEWEVSGQPERPDADDPLADTIGKFLNALLAGTGDPAPYLSPGTEVSQADPAPFADVTIVDMATKDLEPKGTLWVMVRVQATTADGVVLPLSYDLEVVDRGDRWEIQSFSGVPTYIE